MDNNFKVMILDEAGVIDSNDDSERYFVLGGIIYDYHNLEKIKLNLIPILDEYKEILCCEELKSSRLSGRKKDSNLIYGAILSHIRECEMITTFIYVLDKKSSYMMSFYDRKSFKYNKVIQWMIKDMIDNEIINSEDKFKILLDKITLSANEENNLKNWLKNNVANVISLDMEDSKDFYFIQIADLIAGIPKLKGTTPVNMMKDTKLRILKPDLVHIFPYSQNHKYVK